MANKLKLASERRKLALRAQVLANRAKIASLQEQTKRARDELKSMSGTKRASAGSPEGVLRQVRLGGK